jgi:cytochrome c5
MENTAMRYAAVLALLLITSGCATSPETPPLVTQCDTPRPQVCTMEYDPVCAQLQAGGRKTYSSPCNACADDTVSGYLRGACPE